ncbi:hypothetical protein DKG77_07145 [Flagellimonas aquimarina]|uniref:Macroglobulin domain-containing protein n=1 Tax=Flagellimonas aquimarina TaxID=2201895 RepID=A0A316KV16_9FLAO|nr:hypothetical protein [Allomuricauda koreensis]PWL38062.1 hypothetical protein DKG77_07145 [Allomuricauda koreensis]
MEQLKKHILAFFLILFMGIFNLFGQSLELDYSNIPQEKIFIHYNNTLLYTGEYLYYKVYNLNSETNGLSNLSKIAYVELVSEDKKSVFKQKVRLENSSGQGDFFIPTTVRSGNYKLIGYTQWMKNGGKNNFFQGDIAIINPYQGNQEQILKDTSIVHNNSINLSSTIKELGRKKINISIGQDTFKRRSKVSLKIKEVAKPYAKGTYSLSVRSKDTIEKPLMHTSKSFYSPQNKQVKMLNDYAENYHFLPEFRGELIFGRVFPKDSTSQVENVNIALSIPEKNGYDLKVVTTDKNGNFLVSLENPYNGTKAFVQVLGKDRQNYTLKLGSNPPMDYSDLTFNRFEITPQMKNMIVERSVHNQIENTYFSIKPDSLKPTPTVVPVYKDILNTYVLDDYTRFSTIKETLIEVIELVWSKKIGRDEYTFQIKENDYDFYMKPDFSPLVVVDGVPVQNHNHLLEYNARNVKRIGFLRSKYILGSKIFQGILDIETFDGNYVSPYNGDHRIEVDLFKPLPIKNYFRQKYTIENKPYTDRILDFRHQLVWEPNFKLNSNTTTIDFFTSDITGEYEICLEGFTASGESISIREVIWVN